MKPKLVVPLATTAPLYGALATVVVDPDVVTVPFQRLLTDAPDSVTVHDDSAEAPAVTVTSPW